MLATILFMVEPDDFSFDTLSLHAGQRPDKEVGARAVPIYQTAAYVFEDTEHAASLFNLERPGYLYSRISNPTVAVFEERMAALEGGVGSVATASGQAALHLAIVTLMDAGSHIVASRAIYAGSRNLFSHTLPRFGITTTVVDPRDLQAWADAVTPETRLFFTETLGNPGADVTDIAAVADVAHSVGVPFMVDNTFATPYLFRPFEHGADIVVHSATKFIGGHGVAIGGVMVDGGTFPWNDHSDKFPTLTEPYAGYHGLNFSEEYGTSALAARARAEGLRDFGATMAAQTAFYLLQGLETLPVRMDRHVQNTAEVIDFLVRSDSVEWVSHPSIPDHPDHALAQRLLPKGAGAVLSFGIKGGREAGRTFIESLDLWSHGANIGDAKSMVIHPASTINQQLNAEELRAVGVGEELIRLSVGLEDATDLIGDLARALKVSQR